MFWPLFYFNSAIIRSNVVTKDEFHKDHIVSYRYDVDIVNKISFLS